MGLVILYAVMVGILGYLNMTATTDARKSLTIIVIALLSFIMGMIGTL